MSESKYIQIPAILTVAVAVVKLSRLMLVGTLGVAILIMDYFSQKHASLAEDRVNTQLKS